MSFTFSSNCGKRLCKAKRLLPLIIRFSFIVPFSRFSSVTGFSPSTVKRFQLVKTLGSVSWSISCCASISLKKISGRFWSSRLCPPSSMQSLNGQTKETSFRWFRNFPPMFNPILLRKRV